MAGFDRVVNVRLFVGSNSAILIHIILTMRQLICHHGGFRKVAVPVNECAGIHGKFLIVVTGVIEGDFCIAIATISGLRLPVSIWIIAAVLFHFCFFLK